MQDIGKLSRELISKLDLGPSSNTPVAKVVRVFYSTLDGIKSMERLDSAEVRQLISQTEEAMGEMIGTSYLLGRIKQNPMYKGVTSN